MRYDAQKAAANAAQQKVERMHEGSFGVYPFLNTTCNFHGKQLLWLYKIGCWVILLNRQKLFFVSQTVKTFIPALVSDFYQWTSTLRIFSTHLVKGFTINFDKVRMKWI